jgi:hypothetical protein
MIILNTDESHEQTEKILRAQAERAKVIPGTKAKDEFAESFKKHLRELKRYPIVIPYADRIIPSTVRLQHRRDFGKMLQILKCVVHIHQHTRPKEVIDGKEVLIATVDDYEIAFPLIELAFQATQDESQSLFFHFERLRQHLDKDKAQEFTPREFRKATGLGATRTKQIIRDLLDVGAIQRVKSSHANQAAHYQPLSVPMDFGMPLVRPEELRA